MVQAFNVVATLKENYMSYTTLRSISVWALKLKVNNYGQNNSAR